MVCELDFKHNSRNQLVIKNQKPEVCKDLWPKCEKWISYSSTHKFTWWGDETNTRNTPCTVSWWRCWPWWQHEWNSTSLCLWANLARRYAPAPTNRQTSKVAINGIKQGYFAMGPQHFFLPTVHLRTAHYGRALSSHIMWKSTIMCTGSHCLYIYLVIYHSHTIAEWLYGVRRCWNYV